MVFGLDKENPEVYKAVKEPEDIAEWAIAKLVNDMEKKIKGGKGKGNKFVKAKGNSTVETKKNQTADTPEIPGLRGKCWIKYGEENHFPLENIPFGAYEVREGVIHACTRIGDSFIDLHEMKD